MNLFCPTCEAAYAGAAACPRCGGRLITPAEAFALPMEPPPAAPTLAPPTLLGRVAVGVIVGLGLFFAGRDVATSVALPAEESEWWAGQVGSAVAFALGALSAAAAGLMAGAGRPQAAIAGLVAGAALGGIFLQLDPPAGKSLGMPPAGLIAAVAVLAAAAALAGARLWPAAADLPLADAGGSRGSSIARLADEQRRLDEEDARPTRWVRVLIGAAIVIFGVVFADALRLQIKSVRSSGRLMSPTLETQFDLGLAILAVLAGGVTAGATTGAGVRHGIIAGAIAAGGVLVLGPRVSGETGDAGIRPLIALLEFLLENPDLNTSQGKAVAGGVLVAGCALAAWLGNQLLPPLAPAHMRAKRIPLS